MCKPFLFQKQWQFCGCCSFVLLPAQPWLEIGGRPIGSLFDVFVDVHLVLKTDGHLCFLPEGAHSYFMILVGEPIEEIIIPVLLHVLDNFDC